MQTTYGGLEDECESDYWQMEVHVCSDQIFVDEHRGCQLQTKMSSRMSCDLLDYETGR